MGQDARFSAVRPGRRANEKREMKTKRNIIEINREACTGCGQCVKACAEGAIQLIDGKATLVADIYCDGLAACVGECPVNALTIVEREAEDFDPEAAERFVQKLKTERLKQPASDLESPAREVMPTSCLSATVDITGSPCRYANQPISHQGVSDSSLSHWPVQIRLVPPSAPFLAKSHLLVASDCTAFAYAGFHRDFLKGRTILVGCPKFDETDAYITKFSDIFKSAEIQSVTIVIMEVPCCSKMPMIVQKGMAMSGKKIPTEVVIVSTKGGIVKREDWTE